MNQIQSVEKAPLPIKLTPEESISHIGIAMIKDPTERLERQWAHDKAIEEDRKAREEAKKLSQNQA